MLKAIRQFFCMHKWTCKASKKIPPSPGESFWSYATMYCDKCGIESSVSKEFREKHQKLDFKINR